MASINVRDVPEETHEALKRKASAHGMSLQRYLVRVLDEHAHERTIADVLAEAREDLRRTGSTATMGDILEAIDAGRSERP